MCGTQQGPELGSDRHTIRASDSPDGTWPDVPRLGGELGHCARGRVSAGF